MQISFLSWDRVAQSGGFLSRPKNLFADDSYRARRRKNPIAMVMFNFTVDDNVVLARDGHDCIV